MAIIMISKEQFLIEHNKLSPLNLQATFALLTKFQEEKKPLLKDSDWSVDKLRIPLISWLLALPAEESKRSKEKKEKQIFKNYPETH
ncbi:MAG: hypothetical protein A3G45_01695 [Candidatus Staskawiczbacteria bacterium RIFCSPLOWO2_12_FULL_37_15]|uniref:Uncharacterized protein n=1 Tax=Candidatus Staskawiczbacteria bacterium RIFCSPLOWO2_12_FULL_37_15 TaxID=1802218 RepID=A0A1G2IPY0_9BACT|nr:MAG: hypothetical protein US35_C0029G0007 [Parcubacteria group bacterium GW2011_GWA2_37_10]OGZ76815.1 MAG: hypothetical protein A3G45_01695 [Candidatus Staskawiczbacteria bacterium RIFCSPLOWO2_12_FULL_37_15]